MDPKTLDFDGNTWTLSLLGSSAGLDVGFRLVRMVGQGLADSISKSGSAAETFIAIALSKAEPKECIALIKQLLAGCLMDGKPLFGPNGQGGIFETAFQGRLLVIFRLAAWAIKENAGDFSVLSGSPLAGASLEGMASDPNSIFGKTGSSPAPS